MRKLKVIALISLVAALIFGALVFAANESCLNVAHGKIFHTTAACPKADIGLLLGCTKFMRNGEANPHFGQRIAAAATLFHAGKVGHLLVSGDRHHWVYNEPDDMRAALLAAGVPTSAITCDYAGFRTLDSVVRAQKIFGVNRCTIISEEFHCARALWIAEAHGVDAVAFAAPDASGFKWVFKAKFREVLARAWCAVDLFVRHREPKLLGAPETLNLSTNQP